MTILELKEKRNKAWEAAKAFVETKRDKDGLLSDEDAKTYAEMEQKVQNYTSEIERMQAMEAMEAELSKPVNTPITHKPMNGGKDTGDGKSKTGRASDAYKAGMLKALRTNFRTISDVLSEGIDENGGYLVPEEYDSRLIDVLTEENIFRGLANVITTSGQHRINIAGAKPAAAWIEEGGELTFGDATFSQINLDAHKLHVAVKVTEELLYDNAFQLENYIIKQFGKALANAEEDAFLNGGGNGKPLGLFAETGGAEIGVTAASATEITGDEIINLVYALKRPYRKSAKFIMNDQTIAAIRKLKDESGEETYNTPVQLAKAISAELSVELAEATLYADDGAAEIVKEFKSGTLSLGIDDIGATVASVLTGATIDDNHVLISGGEDGGAPVAIGFRAKKSNGKYKYYWLYRVKFGIPATNLATKGDSITFSTPTIEGTVLTRNKADASGKHPWKAEVTEGDTGVASETITNWYKQVYEPVITTTEEG